MKLTDLAWAAGIVDGEGNIHGHGTITLTVSMCDAESLWRFKRVMGGSMSPWIRAKGNRKPYRRVALSGQTALKAIKLLTPWLSSVKLAEFQYAQRRSPNAGIGVGGVNRSKATCAQGHPFARTNTYVSYGQRHCRTCRLAANKSWYAKNKHTKFWTKYRHAGKLSSTPTEDINSSR